MRNHKKEAGALKKVMSPEQLNDYVKVSNPGIWMFLSAVIVLLIAFFIWGFVGKLDTTYLCPAVSNEGSLNCYVSEKQGVELDRLLSVTVDGQEYPVISVSEESVCADFLTDYIRHISGLTEDDWVYIVTVQTDLSNGVYEAIICTESVSPISFLVD